LTEREYYTHIMALGELTQRLLATIRDNTVPTDLLVKKGTRILGIKQKLTRMENMFLVDIDKDGIELTKFGEKKRDELKQNV